MFQNKNFKIKLSVLVLLFVFLTTAGLGCKSTVPPEATKPVTLKYWRVWDSQDDFAAIISAYRAMHPNVNIEYRTFRYEEYQNALLEAFAEDRGPDIFAIPNTWVNEYRSKMSPAPLEATVPFQTKVKVLGIKEEIKVELRTNKFLTPKQLKDKFLDVVYGDVVWPDPTDGQDKIMALPLSVDTLAMFYNRDILNAAGLAAPASDWLEFQQQVKKIVKQDKAGNIVQAGAALGTSSNVQRSFDILSVLMMQNGTPIASGNSVTMAAFPPNLPRREVPPGEEALIFYTDFAYPAKEVYTWNDTMPDSLEAFLAGKTAFFFGYAYHLADIKNRAGNLNFSYTALPQIKDNPQVNYANYWVETVAKKSANAAWAWDFLYFAAAPDQVKSYLDKTAKPTALKSLLDYQTTKEDLLPFVSQLLTARSWYHGRDAEAAESIFKEMIDNVVKAKLTTREALNLASGKLQQTM